jgi:hypothetical protein
MLTCKFACRYPLLLFPHTTVYQASHQLRRWPRNLPILTRVILYYLFYQVSSPLGHLDSALDLQPTFKP